MAAVTAMTAMVEIMMAENLWATIFDRTHRISEVLINIIVQVDNATTINLLQQKPPHTGQRPRQTIHNALIYLIKYNYSNYM